MFWRKRVYQDTSKKGQTHNQSILSGRTGRVGKTPGNGDIVKKKEVKDDGSMVGRDFSEE